jgi:hypothetical protein
MPSKYQTLLAILLLCTPCTIASFIVCATCKTTDHGPAGHELAPLNDAGKERRRAKVKNNDKRNVALLGSHQVAKLQNMVENTRQRLNDLKHSQKTVDRSYGLLQVSGCTPSAREQRTSASIPFRHSITKPSMISMKRTRSIGN